MSAASVMKSELRSTRFGRAQRDDLRVKTENTSMRRRWRQLTSSCEMQQRPTSSHAAATMPPVGVDSVYWLPPRSPEILRFSARTRP
jgi:hypothetical protein